MHEHRWGIQTINTINTYYIPVGMAADTIIYQPGP